MQIIEEVEAPWGINGNWLMRIEFDFQPYERATFDYPGCDQEITVTAAAVSADGGKTWSEANDFSLDKRKLKNVVLDRIESDDKDHAIETFHDSLAAA